MKINRLTINNIASIEHAEVDFDLAPLADESLFLITGDTGSGKTTILNSICLALYDKIPAFSALGKDDTDPEGLETRDTRQLMRKGAPSCEVTLTFVGNDEHRYRATWSLRRARGRADGKFQRIKRLLEDLTDNVAYNLVADINREIHRVVGLTFDQFTRTTLLAQGQFATFLKASRDDKSEILEKLTGTGIYSEIGKKIYNLYTGKCLEVDNLEAEIRGANLLSEEKRSELSRSVSDLGEQVGAIAPHIARLDNLRRLLREQRQTAERVQSHEADLTRLTTDHWPRILRGINWLKAEPERLAAALAGLRAAVDRHQPYLDLYSQQSSVSHLADTVADNHAKLGQMNVNKEMRKKRVEDIRSEIKGLEIKALEAKDLLADARADFDRIEKQLAEFDPTELQAQFSEISRRRDAAVAAQNAIKAYLDAQVKATDAASALKKAEQRQNTINLQLADEERQLPAARALKETTEAYLRGHADLRDHILLLRKQFAQTDVCPLCGTRGAHLHDDATLDDAIEAARVAAADAKKAYDDLQSAIGRDREALNVASEQVKKCSLEFEKALKISTSAELAAGEATPNYRDEDILQRLAADLQTIETERVVVEDKLRVVNSLRSMKDDAFRLLENRRKSVQEVADHISDKTIALGREEADLKAEELSIKVTAAAVDADLKRISAIVDDAIADEEVRKPFLADFAKLNAENVRDFARFIKRQLSEYERDSELYKRANDNIEQLHAQYVAAVEAARPIAKRFGGEGVGEERLENLASVVSEFALEVATLDGSINSEKSRAATLADEIAASLAADGEGVESATADSVTLESVNARYEALVRQKEELTRQQINAATMLEADDRAIVRQADNLRRVKELRAEREDWGLLNDTFGGSDGKKFKNIFQSYVLRVLLHNANHYLNMLSGRYLLDCEDGSLAINVIDANQGGAIRNVGLLSGGEGFIVSLALALGLSAISRECISVDTLFIDEGFGTLDAEILDTVIDTLDRLHRIGGRRIGIISHVRELKERIPTQICLKSNPGGTSTLSVING